MLNAAIRDGPKTVKINNAQKSCSAPCGETFVSVSFTPATRWSMVRTSITRIVSSAAVSPLGSLSSSSDNARLTHAICSRQ
jgi:hypothetical protein